MLDMQALTSRRSSYLPETRMGRAAWVGAMVAVALLYILAGKAGLYFASVHASASPVWPPTGIALAAMLVLGRAVWPAIFAGAFVVNITTAGSALTSLGIAAGNTLEAVVGALLVTRFARGAAAFDRARDIFAFAGLALGSTTISATIGVSSLALTRYADWSESGWIWLTWWLGDAAGDLLVAPLLVLWSRDTSLGRLGRRWLEATLLVAVTVGVAMVVFAAVGPFRGRHFPVSFLTLPALLWAGFRFGPRETSTVIALLSAIAVAGTVRGLGPFGAYGTNEALLLLQVFLATVAATALTVAALVWEQRNAERRVRESEQRLRLALETASTGTWEWTIASGQVRWSPSLEAMHGFAPGAFPGTFEAFKTDIHPDDRDAMEAAIRRALERGEHRMEYRIVRPDGTVRWLEGRGEVFSDGAGRPQRMVGVCLDITDRKRSEEERARLLEQEQAARRRAEEMERRLSVLGEIARSIGSSLDLGTVLQRIAEGARALCRSDTAAMFLREEASGAMIPRFRVGPWLAIYDRLRIRSGEGLGGQALLTGRPVRTDAYRDDPNVPPDLHAVADETGTVALMVVPITIGAEIAGLLYVSNRTRTPFTDEDETVGVRLAEQAAVAIQNARLFAREEAARTAAEQASQLKDDFLAMLGHELRNPIGAIGNAAQVLRHAGAAGASRARDVIERQVHHLSRLMDDLLDVSRVMRGKIELDRQPLDLAEAVERAVAALSASGESAKHRLRVQVERTWIVADAVRIDQVAMNLLQNAIKYTPAGGLIEVGVRLEDHTAILEVGDSGVGISPDLLPRVFDLFVQGERTLARTSGGLGIGLTLVRRIVELHGGSIEARSEGVGHGSRFIVRLPAAAAPAVPEPRAVAVAPPARRQVLVIEDNDDSREMLCALVRLLGHDAHGAREGVSGVTAALQLSPDLTLVDIGLPGIDGYEVARRIRSAPVGRHLRLLALTGYGLPEDRARALAAGFDAHLVKPVDATSLTAILACEPPTGTADGERARPAEGADESRG